MSARLLLDLVQVDICSLIISEILDSVTSIVRVGDALYFLSL